MLKALTTQLDLLDDDDYMSTSSKAPSVNLDKDNEKDDYNDNEDMEKRMPPPSWAKHVEKEEEDK